jgi:hypothetical protein
MQTNGPMGDGSSSGQRTFFSISPACSNPSKRGIPLNPGLCIILVKWSMRE